MLLMKKLYRSYYKNKTKKERDALQREFEQKEADIIILRKELDTFRQDNSILSSSQSELEVSWNTMKSFG